VLQTFQVSWVEKLSRFAGGGSGMAGRGY